MLGQILKMLVGIPIQLDYGSCNSHSGRSQLFDNEAKKRAKRNYAQSINQSMMKKTTTNPDNKNGNASCRVVSKKEALFMMSQFAGER